MVHLKKEKNVVNTMERRKLDGVGGDKLCCNTAPVAATNNRDFVHGFVWLKRKEQEKEERRRGSPKGWRRIQENTI